MLKICIFSSGPIFSMVLCEKQCSWPVNLSSAGHKNVWSWTSQPPQTFMMWCLDTDITSSVISEGDLIFHGVSPWNYHHQTTWRSSTQAFPLSSAGSIRKYNAWRERYNQSTGFMFSHFQVLVQMSKTLASFIPCGTSFRLVSYQGEVHNTQLVAVIAGNTVM